MPAYAALADRLMDGDVEDARHLIGARDELAIMTAFLEQCFRVRLLEIAAADFGGGDLRGDREHGDPRAVTIEQSVDEVQVAGPAAPRADRELARQMRLGAGRERGDLLVPDVDPLDLSLAPQGVGQPIEAVAHDPVDAFHAGGGERFDELVSHKTRHGYPPESDRGRALVSARRCGTSIARTGSRLARVAGRLRDLRVSRASAP